MRVIPVLQEQKLVFLHMNMLVSVQNLHLARAFGTYKVNKRN